MTNKDLANLIFPNITKTIDDYEMMYPDRNLKEGEKVTRIAPSPTGYMHLGTFFQALINYLLAKNSNGVFYVRNEDTDTAREVEGAVELIMDTLQYYDVMPDEYEFHHEINGKYGPYTQSERKEIYHTFIKYLIEIGRAYPCFCTKEELSQLRERQEKNKIRPGYYGEYAKYRNISVEEAIDKIKAGEEYVIRFRSLGDESKKIKTTDLVKGTIEFPENDEDFVIMKSSDRLPTYHFAHVVDDYLMKTTHVVRGEEWLSSLPKHLELFKAFGIRPPKYIHTPLIVKREGNSVRKLSKRKDPEASMSFYREKGYPKEAVIESLMIIINSNYEEWHNANLDKSYKDFVYSPKKMSSSGGLYDLDKLNNISKNVISKMTKEELYQESYEWSKLYSKELQDLIEFDEIYYKNILNIEREQKKPRKDIAKYDEIVDNIWYMYDNLYYHKDKNYEYQNIVDKDEIRNILNIYMEKYFDLSDKDKWFDGIKNMCDELGYASNMKEYKENPDQFKGNVADVSTVLRVSLTTKCMTPDLYEIMKLLGKDRILERFSKI